jgi:hypothetical protein
LYALQLLVWTVGFETKTASPGEAGEAVFLVQLTTTFAEYFFLLRFSKLRISQKSRTASKKTMKKFTANEWLVAV